MIVTATMFWSFVVGITFAAFGGAVLYILNKDKYNAALHEKDMDSIEQYEKCKEVVHYFTLCIIKEYGQDALFHLLEQMKCDVKRSNKITYSYIENLIDPMIVDLNRDRAQKSKKEEK